MINAEFATEPSTATIPAPRSRLPASCRRGPARRAIDEPDLRLDLVERVFRQSSITSRLGRCCDDLTAEFRADRTAGAGDQDRLAADVARKQVGMRRHGVAAEQVVHLDGSQVADRHAA